MTEAFIRLYYRLNCYTEESLFLTLTCVPFFPLFYHASKKIGNFMTLCLNISFLRFSSFFMTKYCVCGHKNSKKIEAVGNINSTGTTRKKNVFSRIRMAYKKPNRNASYLPPLASIVGAMSSFHVLSNMKG